MGLAAAPSCQPRAEFGPFLGTLNIIRCRIILRTQNGDMILAAPRMQNASWVVRSAGRFHNRLMTRGSNNIHKDSSGTGQHCKPSKTPQTLHPQLTLDAEAQNSMEPPSCVAAAWQPLATGEGQVLEKGGGTLQTLPEPIQRCYTN